jgi:hypothetical protein
VWTKLGIAHDLNFARDRMDWFPLKELHVKYLT